MKGLKPALRGTKVPFDSAAAGRRWLLVLSRSQHAAVTGGMRPRLKGQLRVLTGAAHAHVREQYIGDAHLLRYARLLGTLIGEG